jgi:hypothetical protein
MLERDALTAAQELAREEHLSRQEAKRVAKLDPLIDRTKALVDWLVNNGVDYTGIDEDMDRAIDILSDCLKGDEEELPLLLSVLNRLEQHRREWRPKERFAMPFPRPPRESETPVPPPEPSVIAEVREEPLVPASDEVAQFARAESLAPRGGPGRVSPRAWRSQKSEGWIHWQNVEW